MGYITLKNFIQSKEHVENVCRAAELLRDIPQFTGMEVGDDGLITITTMSDWYFDNLTFDAKRDGNYLTKQLNPTTRVRLFREAKEAETDADAL